jgi:hypothetical protein
MQPKALSIWLVTGTIAAIAIAWLAAQIHASGRAPLGLTSIAVGALLGAALSKIAAMLGVAGPRLMFVSAILFALLTVIAEHAWLYRDYCRQWQDARRQSAAAAVAAPQSPPSPRKYFAHEWNPKLWLTDAVLIVAVATFTAVYSQRAVSSNNETPPIGDTPQIPDL